MLAVRPPIALAIPIAAIAVACAIGRSSFGIASRFPPLQTGDSRERPDDSPLPEYISGDECLFCHRFETGQNWQENRHNRTIRRAALDVSPIDLLRRHDSLAEFADATSFVLGRRNRIRFLKKSEAYGQLDLLTAELIPASSGISARVIGMDNVHWDANRFGRACAGCHTTQTDSRTQSFASVSLDCYVCHGNVTLNHTEDSTLMLLARSRRDPPPVVVSLCGQCHLRGGRSNRTGLPYPNNFIAGSDLFSDFQVNFAAADDPDVNPADRHVYHNARAVIEQHKADVTCLNCHSVHDQSSAKHRRVTPSDICYVCHDRGAKRWTRPNYEVHSSVCGY